MSAFARFLRRPPLHFLLLGGLLFAVQQSGLIRAWGADLEVIEVSAADIERFRQQWRRETAREPGAQALDAAVARIANDEILLREALKLGLDRRDPVIRQRMLRNMRFAYPDSDRDDHSLLDEAQAMGMAGRDPVLRRRLIQLMQMRLVSGVVVRESDLRAYAARYPERYGLRPRYDFEHVFLSRERGVNREAEAGALLEQLRADAAAVAEGRGDAFLLGTHFRSSSHTDIAKTLGPDFAETIAALEVGRWSGPIQSPYGWHLVRINRKEMLAGLDLEQHRAQLAYAAQQEVEQRELRLALERLRRQYRIEVAADVVVPESSP